MPVVIDPVIAGRVRAAWARLSEKQRAEIRPLIERGHAYTKAAASPAAAVVRAASMRGAEFDRELAYAKTVLEPDQGATAAMLPASGVVLDVGGDGSILGTGRYEELDPGWLECFAEWLEHFITGVSRFNTDPVTRVIAGPDVLVAIAGDWGTGDWRSGGNASPSERVRQRIAGLKPDITIHLGDVYYSGTSNEEQYLFEDLWPPGADSSWALNSNHEMYAGAKPYFKAIGRGKFATQESCSYFALELPNWVIVGLDSAYFSDRKTLYKNGALFKNQSGGTQVRFLQDQIAKGKKVILMTHHNGLSLDGTTPQSPLWNQVLGAFPAGAGPDYWYWGHVHSGVVYAGAAGGPAGVRCRCCGHGALPGGEASSLKDHGDTVAWYQKGAANDPDISARILNGFATIRLNGASITETFYDENGVVAWDVR